MEGQFRVTVSKDAEDLALRVAGQIRDFSLRQSERKFFVALSGGATPQRIYQLLGAEPLRKQVHWNRLEFFFGDERAVPPEHPNSNYGMVHRALLSNVCVTAHRMPADTGDAAAYQDLIGERIPCSGGNPPAFDLVLLGIGQDGHTASLFPGTPALRESVRWVVMNEVPQLRTRRMTFTYALLNAARRVWVLVAGRDKGQIVDQCLRARLEAGAEHRWPILGVRPAHGELVWWLDESSAEKWIEN